MQPHSLPRGQCLYRQSCRRPCQGPSSAVQKIMVEQEGKKWEVRSEHTCMNTQQTIAHRTSLATPNHSQTHIFSVLCSNSLVPSNGNIISPNQNLHMRHFFCVVFLLFPWGYRTKNKGTRFCSCLCPASCVFFVWSIYPCFDEQHMQPTNER